eukprot:3363654-Prymnesium_polylepis.2
MLHRHKWLRRIQHERDHQEDRLPAAQKGRAGVRPLRARVDTAACAAAAFVRLAAGVAAPQGVQQRHADARPRRRLQHGHRLSLIHISEPTRRS